MYLIETPGKFLKNELLATKTYRQALDKLRDDAKLGESESLRLIYENHKDEVFSRALMRRLG